MMPNELTFTGYEFDGSQFNEIISDFSSFLSSEKVKFQIGIQSRNLKEISKKNTNAIFTKLISILIRHESSLILFECPSFVFSCFFF